MKDFIKKKNWKQIILFLAIASVIVYLIFYFFNLFNILFSNSQTSECHEIYGSFGSYVGGIVGTIIGAITLILVYKTYTSQKQELKLQKQLIAQQQFESTFFNMLNVHRELKKDSYLNVDNSINHRTTEGIFVFSCIRTFLNKKYEGCHSKNEKEKINNVYKCTYDEYQHVISHYCRNVYHILKYIRENEEIEILGKEHKKYKNYADIFQSQLNVDEQFLLFYNFIYFDKETEDEMFWTINLVNHYQFLENLGSSNLLNKKGLHNNKNFYTFDIK